MKRILYSFVLFLGVICAISESPAWAGHFVEVDIAKGPDGSPPKFLYLAVYSSEKTLSEKRIQGGFLYIPSRIIVKMNKVSERAEDFCRMNGYDYSTHSRVQDLLDNSKLVIIDRTWTATRLPAPMVMRDRQSIKNEKGNYITQDVNVVLPHSIFKQLICRGYVEDAKSPTDNSGPSPYSGSGSTGEGGGAGGAH